MTGRADQPRSYVVKTENNSTVRANRRDLLSTPEQFKLSSLPDYEIELPSEATTQVVQPAPSAAISMPSAHPPSLVEQPCVYVQVVNGVNGLGLVEL